MQAVLTTKTKDEISLHFDLLEEFDKLYGLKDHSRSDDISTVLELHPEEDPITGSKTLGLIDEIIGCRIPELTNMGLEKLLDLPPHILDHILERGRKVRKEEAAAFNGNGPDLKKPV